MRACPGGACGESRFRAAGRGRPLGADDDWSVCEEWAADEGPPTGVTLQVVSATSLRVFMNPPQDDGGDTVTKYKVQWDLYSNFSSSYLGEHEITTFPLRFNHKKKS